AALAHRAAVVGDRAELLDGLAALATGTPSAAVVSGTAINPGGERTGPVFVFPGQGSQWAGMAVDLLDASPVFLAAFESCEHALAPHLDFVPSQVLRGDDGWLDRVEVVQPLLFAVMVSLAALWRSCGVEPVAVVGHSQGEVAAAAVCGALSLADAAKVVALRSRAIAEELSGRGGMVSVALPADTVRARLPHWQGAVELAAVNGPASVVVSGTPAGLADLVATFTGEGKRAKHIPVDYASHSAQVAAIRDRLRRDLAGITPRSSDLPFYSAVTGEQLDTAALDAEYWYANLRETVRFDAAITALLGHGHRLFIEVSPHPVLAMAVRETDAEARVTGTLRRDEDGPRRFHTSLAEAGVHGAAPDWTTVFPGAALVDLPTYAFQRKRYWPAPHQWTTAPPPAGTAAEDRFWSAVESGDATEAADVLDLASGRALAPLLPALSAWRRGLRERAAVDAWRYAVTWLPVAEPDTPVLTGRWLIVTPDADHPVAVRVAAALRDRLATVDTLVADPATADAADLSDRLRDGEWTGVLSLLALDTTAHPAHPVLPSGLAATLTLLHALLDADPGAPLWCVTQGAVAAAQDAPASPEQAQVWGLGRVAALEHPRHWGGLVDLPDEVDARAATRLVAAITRDDGEDQLAVRPAGLLARRLVRASGGGPVRTWRPSGAVLVTGGTGAIGGHVARWLADNGAADLVLVSRRGADAPGAEELARDLAARGASVTFAACDVADRAAVATMLDDLRAQGLPVRTVMHTAGASTLERLEHTGVAVLAGLVGAKAAGARNLTELLDPSEVDAIVHFSSIAGVWGVGRHGGYAAGNAYLDALAQRSRADGVPALSVAWGPWDGGGMVAATEVEPMLRRGVPLIEPAPAVRALQQALDHDDTFVAAAEVDWYRFTPAFTVMRPSPLIGELPEVKLVAAAAPARAGEPADDAGLAATLAGQTPAERERT
ncbi:MAG: SDR family NAD(P)-dependent oxidoreductase, partial [Actinophytocola sp.]|uniref:SDR family NAD(P)-dependent oxidoreductase n=1 Tax=Actinophytocola sp. TaxID=1872138 RepID=UPI003C74E92A